MLNSVRLTVTTCMAIWLGCAGQLAQQPPPADPNQDIRDLLGDAFADQVELNLWPEDTDEVFGFSFKQSDYPSLGGFQVKSDATIIPQAGIEGLDIDWVPGESTYWGTVERTVVLEKDEKKLTVRIRVTPRSAMAKRVMASLLIPNAATVAALEWMPVWGPDFGVSAGDALILRDRQRPAGWDGNASKGLFCVQRNILLDLTKDEGCDVVLPSLASAMAQKVVQQESDRVAAQEPLRPGVTLDLSENDVDFPAMDAAGNDLPRLPVDVSIDTSGWTGSLAKYGFLAEKSHPIVEIDVTNGIVYDESIVIFRPWRYPEAFDNVNDPACVSIERTLPTGTYHAAVAVWGENLVPAFAFDTVNVVRGK